MQHCGSYACGLPEWCTYSDTFCTLVRTVLTRSLINGICFYLKLLGLWMSVQHFQFSIMPGRCVSSLYGAVNIGWSFWCLWTAWIQSKAQSSDHTHQLILALCLTCHSPLRMILVEWCHCHWCSQEWYLCTPSFQFGFYDCPVSVCVCRMANGLGISRTKWQNWWCNGAGLWSCHLSWWGGCSLIIRQPHMATLLVWTRLLCVFPCSMYQSHQQILSNGATLPCFNVFACHTLTVEDVLMTVL